MDASRREFTVLTVTSLAALPDGVKRQLDSSKNDENYSGVAYLFGTEKPPPEFFEDKGIGTYIFQQENGTTEYTGPPYDQWTELPVHLVGYETADLPTDPLDGALFHDLNRGIPAWYDQDHYEYPNFVDDVKVSETTVANTTTRTQVWDPDINADSLVAGRIYQIDLHGTYQTANTSDQFTVDIDIAGTDTASVQNAAANANAGTPWTLELTFTVRQHGTNGLIKPNTRATFDEQPRTARHAEISVDTTTATNLSVFLTWDAADPDNSVTLEQAHLKQMG